jgi:hypothetical protein
MSPAGDDHGREAEQQADEETGAQDHREVRAGLGERRSHAGATRLHDREPEHGVEEEARRGDRRDDEHDRDQHRAAQHVEGLVMQRVCLQVVHGEPDPHRRQDLHQRQPPIREQQPEPVEQHREPTDHEGERSEQAMRPAEAQDHLLSGLLVAIAYRPHKSAKAGRDGRVRPCGRPSCLGRGRIRLAFAVGGVHSPQTTPPVHSPAPRS